MYLIKERWRIQLLGNTDTEYYTNKRKNLKQVKKYIKDWIEGWQESAEENEYQIKKIDTDYRTFAVVKIQTRSGLDSMRLRVSKIK